MIVELRDDRFPGVVGIGEGYPDRFYGETVGDHGRRPAAPARGGRRAGSDARAGSWPPASARPTPRSPTMARAKCALDIALHDLVGKVAGVPIAELLGLPAAIPPTDFTLGLDEPAVVAERARRASRFPALKIKVGGPADLATLEAVRAVYERPDPCRREHRLAARTRPSPCFRSWSDSASS